MDAAPPLCIVICPWLAFGHLLPYLELADRLAERGHRVLYVSTPRNIARLPPLRPAAAPRVEFVGIPLPRVEGLPDGAESTSDVPADKRELHFKAFDGLAAPFAEFLAAQCTDEATRPHWIIAGLFNHWAAAAAVHHKVPCAMFLPTAAMIASVRLSDATAEPPAGHTLPRYERAAMTAGPPKPNHGPSSAMSVSQRYSLTLQNCTLGAIRSCLEWEPETFPLVAQILGKPAVPIGLLPPSPDGGRADGTDAAVRWLDAQPPGSVVYVALGSEVPLPVAWVHELALGLELAGTRFLWALRKPRGVVDDDDAGILPPGFEERTRGRGLVTMRWVPQISVLAHAAVGAFLTHCGRNSLIEGLLFGRPLVMLPIFADQGPNARQMEGKKVGVQVARDENDGSFTRQGVAAAVRAVMLDEEARKGFVANARKMQEIVADKELHERYIDQFVDQLRSYTDGNGNPATSTAAFVF